MRALSAGLALIVLAGSVAGLRANPFDGELKVDGSKIVGGIPAHIKDWPGYVVLRIKGEKGAMYFCGGVAINARWAVTAAHCVYGSTDRWTPGGYLDALPSGFAWSPFGRLQVVSGQDKLQAADEDAGHTVRRVIIHPGYVRPDIHLNPQKCLGGNCPNLTGHDIALLEIDADQPFTVFARLSTSRAGDPPEGADRRVAVAGFGRTTQDDKGMALFPDDRSPRYAALSSDLMQAAIPLTPEAECVRAYRGAVVGPGQVCAGESQREKTGKEVADSCNGDSGGPLVAPDAASRPYVIGLTSWGPGKCGERGQYGVYTRVSAYIDWIRFHAGSLGESESIGNVAERTSKVQQAVDRLAAQGSARAGALSIGLTSASPLEGSTFQVQAAFEEGASLLVLVISRDGVVQQVLTEDDVTAGTPRRSGFITAQAGQSSLLALAFKAPLDLSRIPSSQRYRVADPATYLDDLVARAGNLMAARSIALDIKPRAP